MVDLGPKLLDDIFALSARVERAMLEKFNIAPGLFSAGSMTSTAVEYKDRSADKIARMRDEFVRVSAAFRKPLTYLMSVYSPVMIRPKIGGPFPLMIDGMPVFSIPPSYKEDWSGCRSPSRAKRRRARGFPQRVIMVPAFESFVAGGALFASPEVISRIMAEVRHGI